MIKMKHVSGDIETWGKRGGYDIRSIGAVVFDPCTNMVLYPNNDHGSPILSNSGLFYAACDNPLMGIYSKDHHTPQELDAIGGPHRRYNLKRDPETVAWWYGAEQEEASRDAFANPIDLKEALIKFSEFLLGLSEDVRNGQARDICLWTHGAVTIN